MKLIFAGTPAFALPALRALFASETVAAVLTQPDKPQGRKGVLTPSPVKTEAERLGIPVLQPVKLREDYSALAALGADLMVTCAYGQILTEEILNLFPKGVWNIHASLLPAYRGAAPIARAIIDGAAETGVTIMKTDAGIDTGDMFLSAKTPIAESDTCGTLTERLGELGAELIVKAVKNIAIGSEKLTAQGEGFVCKKVSRTEVDFSKPAKEVCALIRGLSPAPLSFASVGGQTLNFYFAESLETDDLSPSGSVLCASPKGGLVVKCGDGAVRITELQPAGGKRMSARDYLNGRKIREGMCFDKPVL